LGIGNWELGIDDFIPIPLNPLNNPLPNFLLTKNFLMVQAPGFIRGINPKSKI